MNEHLNNQTNEQYFNEYSIQEPQIKQRPPKRSRGKKALAVFAAVTVMAACSVCGYLGGVYANGKAQENGNSANLNNSSNNSNVVYMSNNTSPVNSEGGDELSISEIAAMAADSVVEIVVQSASDTGYIGQTILTGAGSGVILTQSGYIITNNHVVEGADSINVRLRNGEEYEAKLIGTDSKSDIAVIKIDAENLTAAVVGDSSLLQVGELAVAIGNPLGELGGTVTDGIISALDREITIDGVNMTLLQTNAAINPGNSGGALVNTRGELVGINTLIKSQTGSYIGYSFAIPESIVKKVVVDLKEYGVVQRALLGISYRYIDQDFIDQMGKETGIKELGGVYVATVSEDGAASAAGIRKGDVIVAIDGVKIDNASAVQEQIAKHRPNDKVKITVKRDGAVKLFDVTLRNKAGKTELITREAVDVTAALGGKFRDAGTKLCQELEIKGGVQVVGIKSNGILARARVKEGFVITHINDRPVYSLSDMERMSDKITSIDGIYPNGRAASYMLVE